MVAVPKKWREVPEDWHIMWCKTKRRRNCYSTVIFWNHRPRILSKRWQTGTLDKGSISIYFSFQSPTPSWIQLKWYGGVKRSLASRNSSSRLIELEIKLRKEVRHYTPQFFKHFVTHYIFEESKYRQIRTILDILNVDNDDDNQDFEPAEGILGPFESK